MIFFEFWDKPLLAFFTKIAHSFQLLTGRTCFFLAYICISVFSIVALSSVVNYWLPVLYRETSLSEVFVMAFFVPFGFWQCQIAQGADRLQGEVKSFHRLYWENPVWKIVRVLLFFNVIAHLPQDFSACWYMVDLIRLTHRGVWIFGVLYHLSAWFYTGGIYFAGVAPLPPGKSKVRQWLESFQAGFSKLQPARSPNR